MLFGGGFRPPEQFDTPQALLARVREAAGGQPLVCHTAMACYPGLDTFPIVVIEAAGPDGADPAFYAACALQGRALAQVEAELAALAHTRRAA